MSEQPRTLGRRIMATSVASALALTSVIFAAGAATADPSKPEFGDINKDASGSITLHKRESGSRGTAGSVSSTTDGGQPVADVVFTYFPITSLDLKTTDGWQALSGLTIPENACDGAATGTPTLPKKEGGQNHTFGTKAAFPKTGANGDTTVDGLNVGAYLVCETESPTTVKKKATPFIVTIPAAKPDTKGWTYDVHAYPKNTVIQPATKTAEVDDLKHGIGTEEQVTFTIKAKIPQLSNASDGAGAREEYFKHFMLVDSLQAGYVNGEVKSVHLADSPTAEKATWTPIAADKYNSYDSKNLREQNKPHWMEVSFTKEGLLYLKANPNKYVVATITAKVGDISNGQLGNTGYAVIDTIALPQPPSTDPVPPVTPPDNAGDPPKQTGTGPGVDTENTPWVPSNEIVTLWGQGKIFKHAANGAKTKLAGAVFTVHEAQTQDESCSSNEISTQFPDPISVKGQTEFTSNAEGIVEVAGLFITKYERVGGKDPVGLDRGRCYIFKEKAAPAGYVLPEGKAAQKAVLVTAGPTENTDAEGFQNTQISVPELPLTGSSGAVLATVAGSSLMLMALGAVLVRRRREAQMDA